MAVNGSKFEVQGPMFGAAGDKNFEPGTPGTLNYIDLELEFYKKSSRSLTWVRDSGSRSVFAQASAWGNS